MRRINSFNNNKIKYSLGLSFFHNFKRKLTESNISPQFFNVPNISPKVLGRDKEIIELYQNFLLGRKSQAIVGHDGIGKSSLAAAFCEAAKAGDRFSCVQWFEGSCALADQFYKFINDMKGRVEKDILLVFDDIDTPDEVFSLLPSQKENRHDNIYIIMTTKNSKTCSSPSLYSYTPRRISINYAIQLIPHLEPDQAKKIVNHLGCIPLLIEFASKLIEKGKSDCNNDDIDISIDDILSLENEEKIKNESTFFSNTINFFIEKSLLYLDSKVNSNCSQALKILACLNCNSLQKELIDAFNIPELCQKAERVGILSRKWENEEVYLIHPLLASSLQPTYAEVEMAANLLKSLWPRRMSRKGSSFSKELVWHVVALERNARNSVILTKKDSNNIKKGDTYSKTLAFNADKAASYLAYVDGSFPNLSRKLWEYAYNYHCSQNVVSEEGLKVAKDYGRLLYHLKRHEEAAEVFVRGLEWYEKYYGKKNVHYALLFACYAPYAPINENTIKEAEEAEEILVAQVSKTTDMIFSKEEIRMLEESIFVLLLCRAQTLRDLGLEVPKELLENIKKQNKKIDLIKINK